ncbi:MAG TPA: UDP-3-O-(3-hydroxymyristoyl)glucosamine N-acyltransferase, partial [Paracoccaceae bacterium]|nr:UDP-3-O-(3-hydroxymyristoyl)glucosamine N-acyltransferase [Paracoccaceae bacterium]
NDVICGGMTGVASNIPPNRLMVGSPAVRMDQFLETFQIMRRLPRLVEKWEKLQKQVLKPDPTE